MRKFFLLTPAMVVCAAVSMAQSRVFKEVSEDIRSEFRPIIQDRSLVGYSMLTQLEKASEDSFNYKLTIMDENLNDIGIVNFKDVGISLKEVAFENDLLALALVKSKLLYRGFKNQKQANTSIKEADATRVVVRFMDLSGKVVNEHQYRTDPIIEANWALSSNKNERAVVSVNFKQEPIIRNISGRGFVLFYRDNASSNNKLTVFDNVGKERWQKDLLKEENCSLLTSAENISLLGKKLRNDDHYTLKVMGLEKDSPVQEINLQDGNGNGLSILDFGNDPVTNKPYVAGMILRHDYSERYATYNSYMRNGAFKGVYSMTITGAGKNDVKKNFSYWKSEFAGTMTSRGRLAKNKSLPIFNMATRDNNGNFYFSGVELVRKPKWGNIAGSVITAPTIVLPYFFLGFGTRKVRMEDAIVLKQSHDGKVSVHDEIELKRSRFVVGKAVFGIMLADYFSKGYSLKGNDAKSNFLILDNPKEITIYDIGQKKIDRVISHKADGVITQIAPAKEGHIMVYEYNKKERSTRLSIEAL